MSKARITLHVVYIHGFQGDHTTFQSFPTDLHNALHPKLPAHVELRSTLYPTYQSKRPISVATQNFLNWLEKLPSGPVILCGHSMGGLLAAEAATSQTHHASKRVIALLAYDVPFLGMHPHVVVSGIASLLPHKKGNKGGQGGGPGSNEGLKSEREMNDTRHVDVPVANTSRTPSPNASHMSLTQSNTSMASKSNLTPPLPPRPSSHSVQSPSASDQHSNSQHSMPSFVSRTVDFLQSHADDPLVTFITQNRSQPFSAAKRWVVESFEFGACMFDPKGLRERYDNLDKWKGNWVAFWTETVPRAKGGQEVRRRDVETGKDGLKEEEEATASLGKLLDAGTPTGDTGYTSVSSSRSTSPAFPAVSPAPATPLASGPLTESERKALEKAREADEKGRKADERKRNKEAQSLAKAERKRQEKELKALRKQQNVHSPHHFIVRPFRPSSMPTHRWEQVKILGAKDEVEAHCGLFLRDVNPEYEKFVQRVASVVEEWIDGL